MTTAKKAIREKWCGESCSLDSRPAKVTGRKCDWACVVALDMRHGSACYSWSAIDRVMNRDRNFNQ